MKVSLIQKDDGAISVAIPLRPKQASLEHGLLLLNLNEIEAQQLEDALHKRKSSQEMRRI